MQGVAAGGGGATIFLLLPPPTLYSIISSQVFTELRGGKPLSAINRMMLSDGVSSGGGGEGGLAASRPATGVRVWVGNAQQEPRCLQVIFGDPRRKIA